LGFDGITHLQCGNAHNQLYRRLARLHGGQVDVLCAVPSILLCLGKQPWIKWHFLQTSINMQIPMGRLEHCVIPHDPGTAVVGCHKSTCTCSLASVVAFHDMEGPCVATSVESGDLCRLGSVGMRNIVHHLCPEPVSMTHNIVNVVFCRLTMRIYLYPEAINLQV